MDKAPMPLWKAKKLLGSAHKSELNDHACGDSEVDWTLRGTVIADAYYGSEPEVKIVETTGFAQTAFEGDEARALRSCFQTVKRESN